MRRHRRRSVFEACLHTPCPSCAVGGSHPTCGAPEKSNIICTQTQVSKIHNNLKRNKKECELLDACVPTSSLEIFVTMQGDGNGKESEGQHQENTYHETECSTVKQIDKSRTFARVPIRMFTSARAQIGVPKQCQLRHRCSGIVGDVLVQPTRISPEPRQNGGKTR